MRINMITGLTSDEDNIVYPFIACYIGAKILILMSD